MEKRGREREGEKSIRKFKTLHGTADASSRRDGGTKRVGVKKKKRERRGGDDDGEVEECERQFSLCCPRKKIDGGKIADDYQ